MQVAVDVGYGFTKALAASGGRAVFASTVLREVGANDLSVVGGGRDGHVANVLRSGGTSEAWRVGSVAGPRSWQTDAAKRDGYDVLVLTALALTGAEGQVEVQVGLPLALFLQKDHRRALKAKLSGMDAWVSVDGQDARRIVISSVQVWPQAAGAVATALADTPSLAERPLGLVDIGFRTTDFLVLRKAGGALTPDESLAGSVDLGIGMAYEAARAQIEREHGLLVSEGEIERSMAEYGGRLWVRGVEVNAGRMLRDEAVAIGSRVADEIRRAWGSTLDLLGAVLLAGGGAAEMQAALAELTPIAHIVRDPLWANVEGYLTVARQAAVHTAETPYQ